MITKKLPSWEQNVCPTLASFKWLKPVWTKHLSEKKFMFLIFIYYHDLCIDCFGNFLSKKNLVKKLMCHFHEEYSLMAISNQPSFLNKFTIKTCLLSISIFISTSAKVRGQKRYQILTGAQKAKLSSIFLRICKLS